MNLPKASWLVVCLALVVTGVRASNDEPPTELFSPDKKFSVRMLDKPMPGVNPDDLSQTLVVAAKGKAFSKVATEGFLISAFWSGDDKYVAVNNRRGNSGDYLWVFSLADGHPIRTPDDLDTRPFTDRVVKKFPEYGPCIMDRRLTMATGWKSPDELTVRTRVTFEKVRILFILTDTYRVEDGHLVLEESAVEKQPL